MVRGCGAASGAVAVVMAARSNRGGGGREFGGGLDTYMGDAAKILFGKGAG